MKASMVQQQYIVEVIDAEDKATQKVFTFLQTANDYVLEMKQEGKNCTLWLSQLLKVDSRIL